MLEDIQPVAQTLADRLEDAWNRGDADAFAGHFARDADFIHILGGHGRGREAIARAHAALFAGIYRASRVRFAVADVRPLGADALVVLLTQRLDYADGAEAHSMDCRPSAVVQRLDEGFRIVLFQNTRTAEAAPAGLAAHPFARRPALEVVS